MARSEEEIRTSLEASILNKDKTIDVLNGPIYDTLIQPIPKELSISEAEASRLSMLHSTFYAEVASADEVDALRTSMRLSKGQGERAKGLQLFWASSIPENGLALPRGTLVSTKDGQFTFQTTQDFYIGTSSSGFYNTENFRYEFTVPIEAIASGTDFNIPEGRIVNLVSEISGIDGTQNSSKTIGGTEDEAQSNTVKRCQQSFVGFDRGTPNGLITSYITNAYPSLIEDVSIIFPKDLLFRRLTSRPAMDIYISGSDPYTNSLTYKINSSDLIDSYIKITLDKAPVLSIISVQLQSSTGGGVETTVLQEGMDLDQYHLVLDDSVLSASTQAIDQLWIRRGSLIKENDKIIVTYSSDNLIINVQNTLFNGDTSLFDTDSLVRKAVESDIWVEITAKLMTSANDPRNSSIISTLSQNIRAYIDNGKIGSTLIPEKMREVIIAQTPNVINLFITTFRKTTYSYNQVEIVEMNSNEIAKIKEPFTIKLTK